MFVQYFSKIICWYLKRINPSSPFATRITNFSGPVSDFRVLLRYYGLIPMIRWAIDVETNPDPNPRIQVLLRLQNLSNLCYYPLEHVRLIHKGVLARITSGSSNDRKN